MSFQELTKERKNIISKIPKQSENFHFAWGLVRIIQTLYIPRASFSIEKKVSPPSFALESNLLIIFYVLIIGLQRIQKNPKLHLQ